MRNSQNKISAVSIEEALRRNREVYQKLSAAGAAPAAVMAEGEIPPSPPPPRPSLLPSQEEPLRLHEPPPRPESPAPAGKSDAPAVEPIRFDAPGAVVYPALREEAPAGGDDPAAAFLARLSREERLRPQSMEVK